MTSQEVFFGEISRRLDAAGIPFMVSGSLASSLHGQPRATNAIDIVIDLDRTSLQAFVGSLPEEWYVSPDAATDALRRRSVFNVIDTLSGMKVDLIVRKERAFSEVEFQRRRPGPVLGSTAPVTSPEDTILSKLEWSKDGESERQYRDALGVALLRWDELDRDYLTKWGQELGVGHELARLLADAAAVRRPE